MRIGVLFNCQHDGLARSLRLLLPKCEVITFGFPSLAHSAAARALAAEKYGRCDVVIRADGGGKQLPPSALRELTAGAGRVIMLPPLIFAGFHPDICYMTEGNDVVLGPTAGLHSRIAIAGLLGGLSVDETAALYNRLVFARLAYPDRFAGHTALLRERYARHQVDITPYMQRWLARGCFMHSFNHPKGYVLLDLARIACGLLDLACAEPDCDPPDTLAHMACHPVYPDLAALIGVPGETAFRPGVSPGEVAAPLDLHQFLAASFAVYAGVRPDTLRDAEGVTEALAALDLG